MSTTRAELNRPDLIAPCGINCRLCQAYGRERKPCAGCRAGSVFCSDNAVHCSVHCEKLAAGAFKYCYQCDDFPCSRLMHLDKRYRTRYATSPIDNLKAIKRNGIRRFVRAEDAKWACPQCGQILCMHKPECIACGYRWHQ